MTAEELKKWQKTAERDYAMFSGYGESGSLSSTCLGIYVVRHKDKVIYRGKSAETAIKRYQKIGGRFL